MRSFRIAVLFIFIWMTSVIYGQWSVYRTGFNERFRDIFFIDTHWGWAVGDHGMIIHTKDCGESWTEQECPVPGLNLQKIQFLNRDMGFIACNDGWVLVTTDGGQNWIPRETGVDHALADLCFIDKHIGWLAGVRYLPNDGGVILKTGDGGLSWSVQLEKSREIFEQTLDPDDAPDRFYGIQFVEKDEGFALGVGSYDNFGPCSFFHTSDGGSHWEKISQPWPNASHMCVLSGDSIWIGGFGFVKSVDGGRHWVDGIPGEQLGVQDFDRVDDQTGWMLGKSWAESRKLYYTENNWASHTKIDLPGPLFMNAMACVGSDYVWLIGDSSIVYHYRNPDREIPEELYVLYQNFPNPFNDETRIQFLMQQPDNVSIKIYTVTGVFVEEIINGYYDAGLYEGKFHSLNHSSGIYIYQLDINGFTRSKKMILCH